LDILFYVVWDAFWKFSQISTWALLTTRLRDLTVQDLEDVSELNLCHSPKSCGVKAPLELKDDSLDL